MEVKTLKETLCEDTQLSASDKQSVSEDIPTCSAIHPSFCHLIREATHFVIVPVVVLVQSVTVLVHFLIFVLKLVIVPIPTMPTLLATAICKRTIRAICTLSARRTGCHARAASLQTREIWMRCRRRCWRRGGCCGCRWWRRWCNIVPTRSAILPSFCHLICKAANFLIIPVMVFVQCVTVLVHFLICVLKLIVIPIPAMPALFAFPFL